MKKWTLLWSVLVYKQMCNHKWSTSIDDFKQTLIWPYKFRDESHFNCNIAHRFIPITIIYTPKSIDSAYSLVTPRIRRASCISFGMTVTRFPWMAHRFASSNRLLICASAASCNAKMAVPCQRKATRDICCWISRTSRAKGNLRRSKSVDAWYALISRRARSPSPAKIMDGEPAVNSRQHSVGPDLDVLTQLTWPQASLSSNCRRHSCILSCHTC